MKQESVNTFNEGLVYDLNPITTPNNVLIDCINGTFLTFNGDELSLQNDAGNTKIVIPNLDGSLYTFSSLTHYNAGDIVYIIDDGIYRYYKNNGGTNNGELNGTDWTELVVKLKPDFYPIGIKEYGGILYIVSAKKPDVISSLFSELVIYQKDDVVYKNEIGTNYYYQSIINNNIEIPTFDSDNWTLIGTEKDFINKFGYIEFGSYPSPEVFNPNQLDTSTNFSCINTHNPDTDITQFKFELYSPKIINKSVFQAGTRIKFSLNQNYFDLSHVSHQEFRDKTLWTEVRKIYKVRLLHQLSNGFIDLTEDVWQKYANFVFDRDGFGLNAYYIPGQTAQFWFNDPDFEYYCPHNYKGKLAITVELEELNVFSINPITIEISGENYVITLPIRFSNGTEWMNSLNPSVLIAYTLNEDEPNLELSSDDNILITNATLSPSEITNITINIPIANQGKIFKYKIIPEFSFDDDLYSPLSSYFPQQFLDKHTLYGTELVRTKYDDYTILLEEDGDCDPNPNGFGYKLWSYLTLQKSSLFVDNELNTTTDHYSFYREGTTIPPGANRFELGTYILNGNKAKITSYNEAFPLTNQDYFTELINNTIVREPSETCGNLVELIVRVNKDFGLSIPIVVTQLRSGIMTEITGVRIYDQTQELKYRFLVKSGISFKINAKSIIGTTNVEYAGNISTKTTIDFGIITNIYSHNYVPGYPTDTVAVTYYTYLSDKVFGSEIPNSEFSIVNANLYNYNYITFDNPVPIKSYDSQPFATYPWQSFNNYGNAKVNIYFTGSSINTNYHNLNNISLPSYVIKGDNIVKASTLLPEKV